MIEDTIHQPGTSDERPTSRGFTLVEILIVVVIIGVLSTVVVFSVRSITDRGDESACSADQRTLSNAVEVYLADESVNAVPATGAGDDRYEQTLIDAGFLNEPSSLYDVNADGTISTTGPPCT